MKPNKPIKLVKKRKDDENTTVLAKTDQCWIFVGGDKQMIHQNRQDVYFSGQSALKNFNVSSARDTEMLITAPIDIESSYLSKKE